MEITECVRFALVFVSVYARVYVLFISTDSSSSVFLPLLVLLLWILYNFFYLFLLCFFCSLVIFKARDLFFGVEDVYFNYCV